MTYCTGAGIDTDIHKSEGIKVERTMTDETPYLYVAAKINKLTQVHFFEFY